MNKFPRTFEEFNALGKNTLPGHLGITFTQATPQSLIAEMKIEPFLLAPNGYLHAGSVVSLADSCCGYGTALNLPEGASGFTTIELKSNHLGTALKGVVECTAKPFHIGRSTQVWDAEVKDTAKNKVIAIFRCTQIILYER